MPGRMFPVYVVRFAGVPPNVESLLRHAVQSVNPTLIARRVRIADDYVREAFVAISIFVAAVALAASYVPARRAARVDPVDALRSD